MLWAATPPQTPPTGPGVYFFQGAKDLQGNTNAYEDGPIQHPPGPVLGGNQSVDKSASSSFNAASGFGPNGRLGGSTVTATGAAPPSRTDTVEKTLRRLAGRLN
jgi:hypothetical protein